MGAHSLGKATRSQNGFDGVWTPNEETTMNTTYFENMVARNLTYKNVVNICTIGIPNVKGCWYDFWYIWENMKTTPLN